MFEASIKQVLGVRRFSKGKKPGVGDNSAKDGYISWCRPNDFRLHSLMRILNIRKCNNKRMCYEQRRNCD